MARRRRGPSKNWKFLLGVVVGIAPVLFFGGGDVNVSDVTEPLSEDAGSSVTSEERLYVDPGDVEYMNRIFIERNHEIGYCVGVDEDRLSFWVADTVKADEGSLNMKRSNCPAEMGDATAHTHPSGRVGLSDQDRATLYSSGDSLMCIHAGEIDVEPGTTSENLVCYAPSGYDDPMRIDVRVAENGDSTPHATRRDRWAA